MKKIFNVGLIGCGHIAETYFRAHKYFNNFKIIKCADINDKAAIKCAKVNDLAVTSGTSLKYKISFANQALGSKEARIRGVSLNY